MSKRIPGLYKRGTQGIWHIDNASGGMADFTRALEQVSSRRRKGT